MSASTGKFAGRLRRGKAIGTIHDDAFVILVGQTVLDEILDYSERDCRRELGGLLLGWAGAEPRPHVEVRHFVPAADARAKLGALTFTHQTWAAMRREADQRFPDEAVVGWQHTHPGFGVFLSDYDRFIHRHFFSEPWQVAMVVDPRRQELGFFQWRGSSVADCGFVCLVDSAER